MLEKKNYCGLISILGKPNVGKSTLFNKILGKKISITSCKPQTTIQCIKGVHNNDIYQSIYIDTPGINLKTVKNISNIINNPIINNIYSIKLIIFVVTGNSWDENDRIILNYLKYRAIPVLLVINKIDIIRDKTTLLPYIKCISSKMNFLDIFIISAKTNKYIDKIINKIQNYLPEEKHFYPNNFITDRSQKFFVTEIVREQCLRLLGGEIPYIINIKIEQFIINNNQYYIKIIIFVKNKNHKKIIVGKKGDKIKKISILSRKNIEKIILAKINLMIWIKTKKLLQ